MPFLWNTQKVIVMYCRYCGKELPSDSNFCPNCGANQKEKVVERDSELKSFFSNHKILLYSYGLWCIIHIGLFLLSTPKGQYHHRSSRRWYSEDYDLSEGFYPFDKSLSVIFQGNGYEFSFLKNVNVYDSSELFIYIIIIPVVLFGLVKCCISMFSLLKKFKARYRQPKIDNVNKEINDYIVINHDNEKKETQKSDNRIQIIAQTVKEDTSKELTPIVEDIKEMPLLRRFVGSIIDKIIILTTFVLGVIINSPYDAPESLGTYIGICFFTPNSYGYYIDLDMLFSFSFIVWNVIYYVVSETVLLASPGKLILGGLIIDSSDEKIGFEKAMTRGLCGGAFMAGSYYLLHLQGIFAIILVVIIYFLILDIPVLFKKKSLLDICTGTIYVMKNPIFDKRDKE